MKHLLLSLLLFVKNHEIPEKGYPDLVYFNAPWGIKQSFNSSVSIHAVGENTSGMGSGNLIRFEGELYIFTAGHVINDALFLLAREKNGNPIEVEVVHLDKELDFAILKPKSLITITEPAEYKVRFDNLIGKPVFHCGHPSITSFNVSRGMITGYGNGHYIVDAMALPGSSGGVVFGKRGDIIGVVVSVGIINPLGPPEVVEEIVRVAPVDYLYLRGILGEQEGEK
jgi:S1-C subfamily serine protease